MILRFHVLPVAREWCLCDIDRVLLGVTQKKFKIMESPGLTGIQFRPIKFFFNLRIPYAY